MTNKPTGNGKASSPKSFLRKPAVIIPAILIIATTAWLISGRLTGNTAETDTFFQVRRADMNISITEGGTVEAAKEVSITNKLEGEVDILYLIPEGTLVEKGDLLAELDSSRLEEQLTEQEIRHQEALSRFTEAKENFSIKKNEAASEIKLAGLAVEFAKIDLEKYIEGDGPQAKNEAQNKITVAEAELKRAQDRLTYTRELAEQEYVTRTELEADELEVTRNELALENARETFRLLAKYEYPKQVRKLQSDVEEAEAALERTKSRFSAELAQAETSLNAREAMLSLERNRLDRVKNQLTAVKLYAPQDGLVVYANYRTSVGEERPVEPGARIRQRQEIIKLPDLSKMQVKIRVHESQRSQVREGQTAFVTIDSISDRRFRGRVSRISVLPDAQSRWLNPDLKVYSTEILIEDELPDIHPGVSARAEILVDQLNDVIQVPIQSVSTINGNRIVHRPIRDGFEIVPVQTGLFNDSFIEIRSGLTEGDFVLLSPPRRSSGPKNNKESPDSETGDSETGDDSPGIAATISTESE